MEIHKKPGYDPAELFMDPTLKRPKLKAGGVLLKKKLGFRYLMNVIGLDADVVGGSHGRRSRTPDKAALFMTTQKGSLPQGSLKATEVFGLLLEHLEPREAPARRPQAEAHV